VTVAYRKVLWKVPRVAPGFHKLILVFSPPKQS
jgi:hypothetical protein